MKPKQYRLYRREFDEETREINWSWLGTFPSEETAAEYADWMRSRCFPWAGSRICGPGELAPKQGYGSEQEQTKALGQMVSAMCPEERSAYYGR